MALAGRIWVASRTLHRPRGSRVRPLVAALPSDWLGRPTTRLQCPRPTMEQAGMITSSSMSQKYPEGSPALLRTFVPPSVSESLGPS